MIRLLRNSHRRAFPVRIARMVVLFSCTLFAISPRMLQAQNVDAEVTSLVARIEKGQIEEVKKALPELSSKYPNNPGVLYLQGRLSSNGVEAAKYYQSIVDNFPKSSWADDALYATYQYYYALGLYKTADLKLQQLKLEYPRSPVFSGKTIHPVPAIENEAVSLPSSKDPSLNDTAKFAEQSTSQPPEMYTLQVGAFATVKNAEKHRDLIETAGVSAVITNKVRGGRSLYLVWAGSFATAEEAKVLGKKIKKLYNIDSIVVEKY